MSDVVTVNAPTRQDLQRWQARALLRWLAMQSINTESVWCIELDMIDCPLVRVTRFVRDETGHMMIDPDRPEYLLRETTGHVQTLDPPAWWQPPGRSATPTTDPT